jgi:uncharacterized glyoxalase superfamily protein PhnB
MKQGVIPFLTYENGQAAMDWLASIFGFKEITRWTDDDGRLTHGEMETEFGIIMLASGPAAFESINTHKQHCEATAKWLTIPWVINGTLVFVSNLDKHYEHARQNGAPILSEPEEGGPGKRYRCEDLEGHRWMFMQS